MVRILEKTRQRMVDLLRSLAARPLSLFCLLLAANALALPYANFFHDANLYGVQVLNRVESGRFASDLYFQYGSQDKYSIFSRVAAPLAACCGLPLSFFLLYVLNNALFLAALQRFVRALVKEPLVSTLVLLFLAVTEIPFGGLRVFHVNEPFLTPRIAANALVLFALERLLAGRVLQASLLIAPALLLHPLMAFPGVLIILSWLALTHLRPKQLALVLLLVALAAAALLIDQPLALRLFGHMDAVWRDNVERVTPYNFPLDWTADDWVRVALSFVVALAAIRHRSGEGATRRLLMAMTAVASIGLAGGIAACFLPYALLLQGQAYRCLWPLQLSLYPLAFQLGYRLWQTKRPVGQLAALGLLACLNDTDWDSPILLFSLASAGLLGILYWRGMSIQPHRRDWPSRAAVLALGLALPIWSAIKVGVVAVFHRRLDALLEPLEMVELLSNLVDPLCRLALVLLLAVLLARFAGLGRRFCLTSLAGCLAAWLVFFVLPQSEFYAQYGALHAADERFVAEFLAEHPTTATPTVYWPIDKIQPLWFDLRVHSYFHVHQVVGNLFNSGNAVEGRRRARLARPFELERVRQTQLLYSPRRYQEMLTLFEVDGESGPPSREDVLRLCQEQRLDFAVLPQEFAGLYSASNGRFFLYDCRAIRACLERPPARIETPPAVSATEDQSMARPAVRLSSTH